MKLSHWTAIGLALAAVFAQLQTADTWGKVFTPATLSSIGLQLSALCIALGSSSVLAPSDPTRLDQIKAIVSIGDNLPKR